jgi:TetR/AcrR family transcriptional regulator
VARGPKKAGQAQTAQRILAAAERIFAERGLTGARTEHIAAAAKANKAMLYYYFGSKEQLYRAVLEHLLEELREAVEAVPQAGGTAQERLLGAVSAYFDFLATHPNYPPLVQRELMRRGPQLGWVVRDYFRPVHRRLARTIAEGIAGGEFRQVDAESTVYSIIGMTAFYFAGAPVLSLLTGRDLLQPKAVAARKRAVMDFLSHGLMPRGVRGS